MFATQKKMQELSVRLFAELAIVVLGVSIALWADSWVSDRSDRNEEIARLYALQDNITETLKNLTSELEDLSGAGDALRKLVLRDDIPTDNLRRVLRYGLLYGSSFSPELNVYDDLKNSGELALLTDRDLRRSLARMDSRIEVMRLAQSDLASVQLLDIDSYIIDRIELRQFYGTDVGLDWVPVDTEQVLLFMSDIHFQNRIIFKLDLVTQLEKNFGEVVAALEEVARRIAIQLENDARLTH